jgi:hypothetical protein
MRYLSVLAALILAGCASLDSDLQSADGKCTQGAAMTVYVRCLDSAEEPIWQKDAPDNLPGYRTFAAARMALAQDLDSGKINAAQFRDGAAQARAKFNAVLAQNAHSQQAQAEAQRAQDALQQMQQQMPPADDGMTNSMGMKNNM